jgi:Ca2+-binding EF-hand superfamily protein
MDEMDSKLAADILSAKDTDSSGSLSASELGVSSSQVSEFDTDGDGVVSTAELTAGLKAKREKMQAQMSNQMQQSGQMGMLQASMGQSGDMSAMDTKMSQDILSDKDTNGDGVLSAEELGVSSSNLSKVDTDGDGSVSESELTASLKANREKMMADNGGQMPPPPGGAEGASGTDGKPSVDNLIAGLFGESTGSSSTASASAASTSSSDTSSATSLAEYLKRQKASSAYMNMDKLIADLFGSTDETSQAVSVSA